MDNIKTRLISICYKMWRYQHFAGLLMTLVYFVLRFLPGNNEGLATHPADEPTTIIKNGSHVYDLYRGNLLLRDIAVFNADVALVFYYAPWSKESMDAFREYEAVADIMHEQIQMTWINGQLPHITVIAKDGIYCSYVSMKTPVHYGGQLERDYLIHFLKKAIMPVHYISSIQHGKLLIEENQFAAIAAFKANHIDLDQDFDRFVTIATRMLEYSVLQIEFGVIVNAEVAKSFFMEPKILYFHDKMNPSVPHEISLRNTTDEVVQYLAGFWKNTVCRDLNFPWKKATYLHDSLSEGPLLSVFVSSPSIAERYHYVRKIRQLAIAYYSDQKENSKNYSSIYAKPAYGGRCCKTYLFDGKSPPMSCSVCLQESPETKHMCFDVDEKITGSKASVTLKALAAIHKRIVISPDNVHCSQVQFFYGSNYNHIDICCQKKSVFYKNSVESYSKSDMSWKNRVLDAFRRKILIEHHHPITTQIFTQDTDSSDRMDTSVIQGLAKIMNKTLQFVILDFDHHNALATNLGIKDPYIYQESGNRFGSAILDSKDEKNYVMKSTEFNLERFIVNYSLGLLPEHLHSAEQVPNCSSTNSHPCVPEITTSTFEEMVINSKKNVLLLYYLPWCLSCTSISYNYLYISDMLHGLSTVLVARIDASMNKLPLPYRVQKYPAVILYPANRSSYSTVFPTDQEINMPNMLSFLLKNLSQNDIQLLLLNICIHAKDYPGIQHAACQNYKIFQRER